MAAKVALSKGHCMEKSCSIHINLSPAMGLTPSSVTGVAPPSQPVIASLVNVPFVEEVEAGWDPSKTQHSILWIFVGRDVSVSPVGELDGSATGMVIRFDDGETLILVSLILVGGLKSRDGVKSMVASRVVNLERDGLLKESEGS